MKKILFTLITIVAFASCTKEEIKPFEGTYKGTFQRRAVDGSGAITNVSFSFSDDTWTGTSDSAKYPALCNGKYELRESVISFVNNCVWTADFDWTFILNGDYQFSVNGDEVQFWKEYPNGVRDIYNLKKSTE